MKTIKSYTPEKTEAVKCALLELGEALRRYCCDIVLIGGCAAYLLTKDYFAHCGIEDIDFALKTKIPPKHETIREIIERLDYVPSGSAPHKFSKHTTSHVDGEEYLIELDFLCDKGDLECANDPRYYHAVQKDLHAVPYCGVSIAFDFNFEQEIQGVLPDDGKAKTTLKVIDLVASLAFAGARIRGKGLYDIFALTHFNGGPAEAAEHFVQTVSRKTIPAENLKYLKESLARISRVFEKEAAAPYVAGGVFVRDFSEWKYSEKDVAAQVSQFLKPVNEFLSYRT